MAGQTIKRSRSPRKDLPHYSGASGTISAIGLARLGNEVQVQRKHDGAFAAVYLNAQGLVHRIVSRTGRDFGESETEGLLGQFIGRPNSILHGEITAHTTAGLKETERMGYRRVHLFDCIVADGKPLHDLSYAQRRDALFRMQAAIHVHGPQKPYQTTCRGIRDRKTGLYIEKPVLPFDRFPIVEQRPASQIGEWMDEVKAGTIEGLVAVSQRAKVRARNSKRKHKIAQSLDCLALEVGARTVVCMYLDKTFLVSKGKRDVCRGDVVSVDHNGWYDTSIPRFPRIGAVRADLMDRGLV